MPMPCYYKYERKRSPKIKQNTKNGNTHFSRRIQLLRHAVTCIIRHAFNGIVLSFECSWFVNIENTLGIISYPYYNSNSFDISFIAKKDQLKTNIWQMPLILKLGECNKLYDYHHLVDVNWDTFAVWIRTNFKRVKKDVLQKNIFVWDTSA